MWGDVAARAGGERVPGAVMPRLSLYLAQVRPGRVEVYRDDSTMVDAFDVPFGARLRTVLIEHGWHPTGKRAAGAGWGVILVEPSLSD